MKTRLALALTLLLSPALAAPAARVSWDCGTMAPSPYAPTECALNSLGAQPVRVVVSARLGGQVVSYTPAFSYRTDPGSILFSIVPVGRLVRAADARPGERVRITARVRFQGGEVREYHSSEAVLWWQY